MFASYVVMTGGVYAPSVVMQFMELSLYGEAWSPERPGNAPAAAESEWIKGYKSGAARVDPTIYAAPSQGVHAPTWQGLAGRLPIRSKGTWSKLLNIAYHRLHVHDLSLR